MRPLHSLICAFLLSACTAPPLPVGPVTVAPGVTLDLPAPEDLGRNVDVAQMVTARHGGETVLFEGRLSVESGRLRLVGTDAMGRRAMTVTWVPGRVEVERASWLPDSLRPENILADIVLLYWPEPVVRRSLSGAGLVQNAAGRTIGDAIAVSWTGDPWTGSARLRNSAWDYELEIRSVAVMP